MKLNNLLAGLFARIKPAYHWLKRSVTPKSSVNGRIQVALVALRERWKKTPKNDVSYTYIAKDYDGSRVRQYLVHLPPGQTAKQPLPLVMVLHGCKQDNRDIEQISGFNKLADHHGFLVVYPFVTSYRGFRNLNCWGWWFKREIHSGAGEVEDLWQIVEEIKSNYQVDEKRIHVTGLSSGAGMAVAMMVAHAGKIASGAAVAGVPYSESPTSVRHMFNLFPRFKSVGNIVSAMKAEMGGDKNTVPLQIIHSSDDETVPIQAATNLRDSWGQCFAINTDSAFKVTNGSVGNTNWEHSFYQNEEGKTDIETLLLSGPGHGWYGGNAGKFSFTEAPDTSEIIWKFFESHQLLS